MNKVGTIMDQLKEKRVGMKRSVWSSIMQSDRTASPCCYYLNNKEELPTFLADPAVPCDSNLIENFIRPAAVIRKNLQCLQTIKSAQSVFDILSVYRTLQLNKVEDSQGFLRRYCRSLFLYIVENAWTAALKDGKDPAKKIKRYGFKELRKGFDFSAWLPWKVNLTKK
ncbi:IS66 family transposase [Turicimonas muris]|uniref:IS66 family transposase n=1 Tax=Turicimonas muris TaxID=1796652 RepID=UPI00248BA53E|nr:transposase [Turicimonas muris]MBS4768882.1 transposase [Burkholderiales bacterium]